MSLKTAKHAMEIAKECDHQAVVVFTIARDGTVSYGSWAENLLKTDALAWWAQKVADWTVTQVPFQTVYGTFNNGVPKPLTAFEEDALRKHPLCDKDTLRFAGLLKKDGVDE